MLTLPTGAKGKYLDSGEHFDYSGWVAVAQENGDRSILLESQFSGGSAATVRMLNRVKRYIEEDIERLEGQQHAADQKRQEAVATQRRLARLRSSPSFMANAKWLLVHICNKIEPKEVVKPSGLKVKLDPPGDFLHCAGCILLAYRVAQKDRMPAELPADAHKGALRGLAYAAHLPIFGQSTGLQVAERLNVLTEVQLYVPDFNDILVTAFYQDAMRAVEENYVSDETLSRVVEAIERGESVNANAEKMGAFIDMNYLATHLRQKMYHVCK